MGYLFSTTIFLFITAFLMGERSWLKGVAISVIFSVGIFFLFIRFLTIPLPSRVSRNPRVLSEFSPMSETFQHLLFGFSIALEPVNLLYAFLGCLVGTLIGVLPGLGPAGGMALLIPLIYGKDPASAVILLAGIYYGAMYGGSTTSILLNLPGEAASVVTTLDGYQMAKQGRAGPALCIAAIGSFIAGTISVVLLMFIGPPMAHFALKFGPAESFALMVFGLSTVSSLAGSSLIKGAVATIFGLMLATIGVDLPTGINRYIFGIDKLMEGFDIIVAAIGLFAVSEIFMALEEMAAGTLEQIKVSRIWISMRDFLDSLGAIIRGTFLDSSSAPSRERPM